VASELDEPCPRSRGQPRRTPGTFGVYARNLTTGDTVAINEDQVFPAESTVKTAIFLHYERGVDTGALDPSQRVRLARSDDSTAPGCCGTSPTTSKPTLDDLAWLMIIVSDNTATAMLVEKLGPRFSTASRVITNGASATV
ncbi:MAG: beta-lactamase class, partial [Actinomycetota bacterium]|nr:beta-lactamase class [Actinomycetota bacterium]